METNNIVGFGNRDRISDALTDLPRAGAQQLIATAVESEPESFLGQIATERTEAGHAAVVLALPERRFQWSNGSAPRHACGHRAGRGC